MDVKINYVKKVLKLRKGFEERKNLKVSWKYQKLLLWFYMDIIFKVKFNKRSDEKQVNFVLKQYDMVLLFLIIDICIYMYIFICFFKFFWFLFCKDKCQVFKMIYKGLVYYYEK